MTSAEILHLQALPWPSAARAELQAIASEGDPELFSRQLLAFGVEQEQTGHPELAAAVYAAAATEQGRERLEVLQGRGNFGPRTEFLLRRLTQEAADPVTILAMGAAGSVFSLTRLTTLSALLQKPAAWMTRGFGARALASLAGFALEAPTFTLTGRLGGAVLGRTQDWSAGVLGRDLASSYLVLGGLKFAGWASGAAYQRLAAGVARERPLQVLAQQGGMLSGILLGHALEQWVGLRRPQDGATSIIDSLAMLLQFHVAGRMGAHFPGGGLTAWNQTLDRVAGTPPKLVSEPALAFAGAVEIPPTVVSPNKVQPGLLMMSSQGEGGGREVPGSARSWVEKLLQSLEKIPAHFWKPQEAPKADAELNPYRRAAAPYASLDEARSKAADLRKGFLDSSAEPETRLWQMRQLPEYLRELPRDPEFLKSLKALARILRNPDLPYPTVEDWPDVLLEREIPLPPPVQDFYHQDFRLRVTAAELYIQLHRDTPAATSLLRQAVTVMESAVLDPGLSTKFRTYFRQDVWSRSYFEAQARLRKVYLHHYFPLLEALPLGCDQARAGFRMLITKPLVELLEGAGPIPDYLSDPEFLLDMMRTHAALLRLLPQSLPEVQRADRRLAPVFLTLGEMAKAGDPRALEVLTLFVRNDPSAAAFLGQLAEQGNPSAAMLLARERSRR